MNQINVTGRLTTNPELRELETGTKVCNLRLAVDRMGRNQDAGYLDVSVYGESGRAASEQLTKGWLVAAYGRLEYREWETDGAKRHHYGLVGNVEFLAAPRAQTDTAPEPEAAAA